MVRIGILNVISDPEGLLYSFFLFHRVIEELLGLIREDIGSLYKLREVVTHLDVLLSFSHAILTAGGFCRPTFGHELVIRDGRHPILNHFSPSSLVSNDTV